MSGAPAATILSDFGNGQTAAITGERLDESLPDIGPPADQGDDADIGPFGTAYGSSIERAEAQAETQAFWQAEAAAQAQLERQAQEIERYLVSFRAALSDGEEDARICDQLTAAIRDMKQAVAKRKTAVRAVPAASFLLDFGNEPIAAFGREPVAAFGSEPNAAFGSGKPGTGIALKAIKTDDGFAERQIETAYARGVEEGKATAQAQFEARLDARLAEQKQAFEKEVVTLRESWRSEEVAQIARQLTAEMSNLQDRIGKTVEHLIKPFLSKAICDRAIGELRSTLEQLVATSPGIELEISGPENLLGGIRATMPGSLSAVSYIANDACDVQVKAGQSLLETRISAWLKQIEWGER